MVCDKLHDHFDHVSVWQQTQKLAGEAAVPYSIIGCCEISKYSTSLLLCQKALLDVLSQQNELIYSQSPMSETSLLPREKRVDGGLDTGVDKKLEDLEGDTQQRDGSITLWILWGLIWLKDCKN